MRPSHNMGGGKSLPLVWFQHICLSLLCFVLKMVPLLDSKHYSKDNDLATQRFGEEKLAYLVLCLALF